MYTYMYTLARHILNMLETCRNKICMYAYTYTYTVENKNTWTIRRTINP